jgi:hypothetical protein
MLEGVRVPAKAVVGSAQPETLLWMETEQGFPLSTLPMIFPPQAGKTIEGTNQVFKRKFLIGV